MPVAPVTYPIMPPVIVVTNSTPKKSEAEIMKENGGHVYFSVHLKHCEECRAEQARREAESRNDGIIIIIACLVGFTAFLFLIFQWYEIRAWFADRIETYKARNNLLYDYERRASKLRAGVEEELRDVNSVNHSSVALLGELTASNIPIVHPQEGRTYADFLKTHRRFFYHTDEATFYIFKRWTLGGWDYYAVRLGYYAHKAALERTQNQ